MALTVVDDTINAGLYARISKDAEKKGLGVARQEKDARALATAKGWNVTQVYVDNDIRASRIKGKTKERPEYQRLLDDIEAGRINAVVGWDFDRMFRDPLEQEQFFLKCELAGLHYVATIGDEVDIATGEGIMIARIKGAVNAEEVRKLGKRVRRKQLEVAESGEPAAGGHRPFGWSCRNAEKCKKRTEEGAAGALPEGTCAHDGKALVEHEADMLRDATRRIIAGESMAGICRRWNEEGKRTGTGAEWRQQTLRNMLINPRIVGRRIHQGQDFGEATYPAILDRATWEKLLGVLKDPTRRTNRVPVHTDLLLGGLVRCGRCDARMVIAPSAGRPSYRCAKRPGIGGCNGVAIVAAKLDELVVETVLQALDTPELMAELAAVDDAPAPDVEALTAVIAEAEQIMTDAADDFAEGRVSRAEWLRVRNGAEKRRDDARRELSQVRRVDVLDELGDPGALREAWPELPVDRRKTVLATIIDRIVIGPALRGRNYFDPERVSIEWAA